MRCDCLCCVMSRDAAQCPGDELVPVVTCNAMECYELKMPLVVITLYSSTSLYYKVLHQYYTSTTPVLPLQCYSALQSTTTYYSTPVLFCSTTPHYTSTTRYYKVLFQHYSVLQSTSPVLQTTAKYCKVLLCTTKYYSSTTLYKKVALMIDA